MEIVDGPSLRVGAIGYLSVGLTDRGELSATEAGLRGFKSNRPLLNCRYPMRPEKDSAFESGPFRAPRLERVAPAVLAWGLCANSRSIDELEDSHSESCAARQRDLSEAFELSNASFPSWHCSEFDGAGAEIVIRQHARSGEWTSTSRRASKSSNVRRVRCTRCCTLDTIWVDATEGSDT